MKTSKRQAPSNLAEEKMQTKRRKIIDESDELFPIEDDADIVD